MGKYAIFIVSALIFSMLTYSSALRNALFQSNFRNIESFSQIQAYNIANSAALVAINDIRNDSDSDFAPEEGETYSYPSSTGFADWEDLAGSYNLQVTNQADTLLVIQSTGRFGQTDYTDYRVTVGLTKGGTSEWLGASVDKAIHSESYMDIRNGEVDGDLSLNEANSEFEGGNPAKVTGGLYFYDTGPVPDDDAENFDGEFIPPDEESGDYSHLNQMDEKIVHPNPIFPNFPPISATNTYNRKNETLTTSTIDQSYDTFETNGTTIHTGDDENTEIKVYVKTLELAGNLNITGQGRVSFYVENDLNIAAKGQINSAGSAKNLSVFYKGSDNVKVSGGGQDGEFNGLLFNKSADLDLGGNYTYSGNIISFGDNVTLSGNPDVSSLVFAPSAEVTITGGRGTNEFRGAIVSDKFINNGSSKIIYDEEFANTLPPLEQEDDSEYVLLYWR